MEVMVFKSFGHVETFKYVVWIQSSGESVKFKCAGISDSMIDAPGKIGLNVFFQGCSLGCPGCQNPELQDDNGGFDADTDDVIEVLRRFEGFYEAVIFVGGEPLQQPDALKEIAEGSKLYNVLYTGWLFEDIPEDIRDLMRMVIDGPYIRDLEDGGFPASSNQKVWKRDKNGIDWKSDN
jgi:anaerobic ribonucleoside-triphosphate reductase activating protein